MLGSFFDLPKEVAAIAAKRQLREGQSTADDRNADLAYDDFERRMRDVMKLLTPGASNHEAPQIRIDDR